MRWILDRRRFALEVWDDAVCVARFTVGIGRPDTPTPAGRFVLHLPTGSADPALVATFTVDPVRCLRATEDLTSLGRAASGG
ncbi:MAG: L,D-transpeptidase [Firmicutes bacterium]|nr:L,D-transpeptidase [Bacillota bacterium]